LGPKRQEEPFYNILEVKYENLGTKQLFLDWNSYFVHEIKTYLKSKDLALMVLLVFHSAPGL